MKPRLAIYTAAPPRRWRAMWNIYYGTQIIGAALQFGTKVVSLQWRRPRHEPDIIRHLTNEWHDESGQ